MFVESLEFPTSLSKILGQLSFFLGFAGVLSRFPGRGFPRLRKLRDPGRDAPGVRDRRHSAAGDAVRSAAHALQCLGRGYGKMMNLWDITGGIKKWV